MMIVSRIDGGLGNQMFQYAYGAYLAKKHNTAHFLDTQAYAGGPQHGYLLDHFKLSAQPASAEILRQLPRKYRPPASQGRFAPQNWLPRRGLRRHKESAFGFQGDHLRVADQAYLVGYWQSERFFPGLRAQLLDEFQFRPSLSDQSAHLAEEISACNSLSLHIRRGDYLSNSEAAKIYCGLNLDYYTTAVQHWAEGKSNVRVYVFSNDIPWCKEHIQLPWDTHFVDHTHQTSAIEDLELMRRAACNVIANSTFSWWAAWLNDRAQTTYAPREWFRPGTLDGSHILPDRWTVWDPELSQTPAASSVG